MGEHPSLLFDLSGLCCDLYSSSALVLQCLFSALAEGGCASGFAEDRRYFSESLLLVFLSGYVSWSDLQNSIQFHLLRCMFALSLIPLLILSQLLAYYLTRFPGGSLSSLSLPVFVVLPAYRSFWMRGRHVLVEQIKVVVQPSMQHFQDECPHTVRNASRLL